MAYLGNTPQTQSFTPAIDYFNGTGATTAFTLSRPVASVAQVQVVIENVPQNPSSAYTVSGQTITFTSAPPSGTNNIYVEYTSPITQYNALSQSPVVYGNLNFGSTGARIQGDFSNATLTNRVAFQNSGTNQQTIISVLPNGTSVQSQYHIYNNSDPTNSSRGDLFINASEVSFRSNFTGTGSFLPMTFYTGGSERMRIDTSGNVGISTSSPAYKLDVNGTANFNGSILSGATISTGNGVSTGDCSLELGTLRTGDGTSYIDLHGTAGSDYETRIQRVGGTNGNFLIANTGTGAFTLRQIGAANMVFDTNNTERMRISAAGGLSVGTTADPGAGAIYATGNITAYYSSDARLKENIKDVDNALDIVCAIGSKTFDWTDEYIASKGGEDGYFVQKSDFGVVAQDVQKVFPQAVRTREDGTLAVDYEKLATLSFGAIKSLLARVEALEDR